VEGARCSCALGNVSIERQEEKIVRHKHVQIILFSLHVSALLESHHQARTKYTKKDNLNKTH